MITVMNRVVNIKNRYMELLLNAAGAAMQRIRLQNGMEPLLSLADPETYAADPSYAGTVIAPVCGRIADARIDICGKQCELSRNEGMHQLHGGFRSAARSVWMPADRTGTSAAFELTLGDGLDGYPGIRTVRAVYSLDGKSIVLVITCTTDTPTLFNPTTHAYWNFHPGISVLDHKLEIPAETFCSNTSQFIPESWHSVKDTAFDFTTKAVLSDAMEKADPFCQLQNGHGYNNGFRASKAEIQSSGLSMTLETDASVLWLYSGGFLGKETVLSCPGHGGTVSVPAFPSCALALEPQELPENTVTEPGRQYIRTVRFSFEF